MKVKAKPLGKTPCFKNVHPGLTQRIQEYYEPMLASGFGAKESLRNAVEAVHKEVSDELAALPPAPVSGDDRFAKAMEGEDIFPSGLSGTEFNDRTATGARVGAQEAGSGVQQTIGGENENISEQSNRLTGITGVFRQGLRSISRATAGLQGTRYYKAESEALEKFADKYEYGQDYAVFDDAYKEQTKDRGKVEGVEHDVLLKPTNGVVVKRKDLGVAIQDYMQRVVDHNEFFPESAYSLEGVSKKGEALYMTVTQPYVKNRTKEFTDEFGETKEVVDPITMDELVAEMKRRGFDTVGPVDQKSFERGWLVFENAAGDMISDLAPRNVLIDQDGKVSIIDPQISKAQESDRFSRPEKVTVDGKERPVTNSNGKPIHATEEGIRNFWKWFGDSKVVDEQGRPLVVYHGTDSKFNTFEKGIKTARAVMFDVREETSQGFFFSTDKQDASEYGSNIIQAYLSANNPMVDPSKIDLSSRSTPEQKAAAQKIWGDMEYILASVVYENEVDGRKVIDINSGISTVDVDSNGQWISEALEGGLVEWDWLDNPEFVKRMEERGYDSARTIEPNDNSGFSWFVTNPTQIKSATGNSGAFDGGDPDIRYSRPFNKQGRFLDEEDIAEFWSESDTDTRDKIIDEYLSGKYKRMPWNVVPAAKLARIWQQSTSYGFVRDEKGLDSILSLMVENVQRLRFNNEISGHENYYPNEELSRVFDNYENLDDAQQEELRDKFAAWAIETEDGPWRISDYGLPKLEKYLFSALRESDYNKRLMYMDMALNVVHQRSDLASLFVEGGSKTLSNISGDDRFSRPFDKQLALEEIKSYAPSITRFLRKMVSWIQPLNRRYDSLLLSNYLTDEIKDVIREMAERSNLQRTDQNRILSTAKEATDKWMAAGKANNDLPQAMSLAFDASLLQLYPGKSMVDQGWGDTPEAARKAWNKAVGFKDNLDFNTEFSRVTREFNALSPETRKAYLGVVAVMADLRTELHDAYINTIDEMPIEEDKKRAMRVATERNFRNLKGAYMPFTRHGEYVAEVFDREGNKVRSIRAESVGELNAQVAEMKAQYPANKYTVRKYDGRVIHKAKENRISPALLSQMKEMLVDNLNQAGFSKVHKMAQKFLEENLEQLSDDQRDLVKAIYKAGNIPAQARAINALRDNVIDSFEVVDFIGSLDAAREKLGDNPGLTKAIDDLEQMFLDTLPDTSALKSSMHRKGIAGWSKDAIRSTLDYANRYGKSLAYMKHGRRVDQLEAEASRLAEGIINPDQSLVAQNLLKDTFENRRIVSEEEVGALGKFSTKIGSLWFLTSPSMMLVQNSQPWAITVPYLAARYGLSEAVSAMGRNHVSYQMGGKFTDNKINIFDADTKRAPKGWNPNLPFSLSRFYATANGEDKARVLKSLTADEKNMLALRLGMDSGVIANSMSFEAVEYARKGTSGQIGELFDSASEKAYYFQRVGETLSRKGSYMAAFELATKAGDSFDEANRKATTAVNETLYDYSATNRPRIISGTFGRFFGQFRTYQLQTLGHILNLGARMAQGDAMARKELGLLLMANFVMAGAAGLPLAGSLAAMLGGIAFLLGEDDEWTKQIEEEMLKTKLGQVTLKGLPMLVGMDLSRRIGMEGLTKVFQGEAPAKATPRERMNYYAAQILGPAYTATAGAMFNMDQAMQDGDWGKALEQGTPRAIGSAFQAMKLNNKGLTDGSGRVIIPEDQINKWDVALMMMGVNPGHVSVAREKERNIREVTDMMDLKKQRLAKDLERSVMDSDGAGIEKAQAAIQRFNQQYPMFGFTSQALASRLKGAWQERSGVTSRKYQAAEMYIGRDEEDEEEGGAV